MENAASAVGKLFGKGSATNNDSTSTDSTTDSVAPKSTSVDGTKTAEDATLDSKVAAPVEHTHVKKEHETREQTVIEKEKHQDHYHTTIQPLKDTEVLPEKHDYEQESKERSVNKDDGAAEARAKEDLNSLESTSEEKQFEAKTKEKTQVKEHVHHHLHETIQPVIEKEVIDPSVTHKRVDVKETIQEPSEYHGVKTNSALTVDEFEKKVAQAKN